MRRRTLLLAAATAAAALPATAGAAGGPVAGNTDAGYEGAVIPGDENRLVAAPHSSRSTFVALVQRRGGRISATLRVPELVTVPGVAQDGTADGRSADGRTAVLVRVEYRFPARRSRLLVLGLRPLRVSHRITLRGTFGFDAISPDGKRLYLVEYVDPKDPRKYVVRSYDVARKRLEPGAIVDAREPDEDMRGVPVSRVSSADGRWAYTLYDGAHEPFIHALDTVRRRAFCIDLPMLANAADPFSLRLGIGSEGVSVVGGGRPLAMVDTKTMRASEPPLAGKPAKPKPERREQASAGGGADWLLAGGIAALALVTVVTVRGIRRRAVTRYR